VRIPRKTKKGKIPYIQFEQFDGMLKMDYVINADFEALTVPSDTKDTEYIDQCKSDYQVNTPC
jgi:hypothetical protein